MKHFKVPITKAEYAKKCFRRVFPNWAQWCDRLTYRNQQFRYYGWVHMVESRYFFGSLFFDDSNSLGLVSLWDVSMTDEDWKIWVCDILQSRRMIFLIISLCYLRARLLEKRALLSSVVSASALFFPYCFFISLWTHVNRYTF